MGEWESIREICGLSTAKQGIRACFRGKCGDWGIRRIGRNGGASEVSDKWVRLSTAKQGFRACFWLTNRVLKLRGAGKTAAEGGFDKLYAANKGFRACFWLTNRVLKLRGAGKTANCAGKTRLNKQRFRRLNKQAKKIYGFHTKYIDKNRIM